MIKCELRKLVYATSILKYIPILMGIIFLLCAIDMNYSGRENISSAIVWSEISNSILYIFIVFVVVVTLYIGRDYTSKVINYEIMQGYKPMQISLPRMVSCSLVIPMLIVICLAIFIVIMGEFTHINDIVRLALTFIIFAHTGMLVLYFILIFKRPIIGALVTVAKIIVLDTIIGEAVKKMMSTNVFEFGLMEQMSIISFDMYLQKPGWYITCIIGTFAIEFLIMHLIYKFEIKHIVDAGV